MKLTFINVGYGESILLECPNANAPSGQFTALIDGGSGKAEEYRGGSGRIRAADYLAQAGVEQIDLLVITHIHEDHVCGLPEIVRQISIGKVWTPMPQKEPVAPIRMDASLEASSKTLAAINTYNRLLEALPPAILCPKGELELGIPLANGLSVDILGPDPACRQLVVELFEKLYGGNGMADKTLIDALANAMNNSSLILRFDWAGRRILLCGDTNRYGFAHLLPENRHLLAADLFKVGHHGQADAITQELAEIIHPSLVVCCASNDLRYGSSSESVFRIFDLVDKGGVSCLFSDTVPRPPWSDDFGSRHGVTVNISATGGMDWSYISCEQRGVMNG